MSMWSNLKRRLGHAGSLLEKTFCCHGFKNLIGEAGHDGFSAVVLQEQGTFKFQLQFRAVSQGELDRLSGRPVRLSPREDLDQPERLKLAGSALSFCPYCGRNLRSLVRPSTWRSFQAMAAEHRRFLIAPY